MARSLAMFLDKLERADKLAKTIFYSINPGDYDMLAAMIGNFQGGSIPGKMQFGSGWWHSDQKEAMEWQMSSDCASSRRKHSRVTVKWLCESLLIIQMDHTAMSERKRCTKHRTARRKFLKRDWSSGRRKVN